MFESVQKLSSCKVNIVIWKQRDFYASLADDSSLLSCKIRNPIKFLEIQKYFEFNIYCQIVKYVSSLDSS